MRYLKGLVALAAIALVIAACAPQEPAEFAVAPQLKLGNPLATAPGITWDASDGYHVDLVGAPMGSDGNLANNPATVVIPDPGNVDRIRVQVNIKGGTDDEPYTQPDRVEFETNTGELVIAEFEAINPDDNGFFTTNFGWHYNAWIEFDDPADVSVTATVYEAGGVASNPCDQQCTPRAFNVWIFRPADAANPANAGGLFHHDVWWGNGVIAGLSGLTTATSTVPIPPSLVARDVTVEFPLSDLQGPGFLDRTATVTIEANGQVVSRTYNNTDPEYLGEELLIGSLTLPDVKKNVSSVDVTFTSEVGVDPANPHLSGGDSFFGSGAAVSVGPIDLTFGRFTGGINHDTGDFEVTGGLTLHCDITLSNNLEINWNDGTQNRWHIEKESLTEVVCSDDPEIEQRPPRAPLDTLMAEAVGTLTYGDSVKNEDGSIIHFTIVDGGEPGRLDMIDFKIWLPGDDPTMDPPVLDVAGYLNRGANLQAHYDQPHGQKP